MISGSKSGVLSNGSKHDRSGHITMDTAMNGFYQENMRKAEQIDLRFRHGLLPRKYERNPLKAEKSPRERCTGFDFSIPSKAPEPERWIFPDTDRGLVSKLPSQKAVFAELKEKEKKHMEDVKRLAAQQAAIFEKRSLNNNNESNNSDAVDNQPEKRTFKDVATKYDGPISKDNNFNTYEDVDQRFNSSSRSNNNYESNGGSSSIPKKKFYKQPISTFKSLVHTNPEILADWRAHRAADFISSQKAPLEPPPERDIGPVPFRPAGGLFRSKTSLQADKKESRLTTDSLETQLMDTQAAIDKQRSKVGKLSSSVKR